MKKPAFALVAVAALCTFAPTSASARMYKICDFHECCYIDGGGNGYCVDRNLQV